MFYNLIYSVLKRVYNYWIDIAKIHKKMKEIITLVEKSRISSYI